MSSIAMVWGGSKRSRGRRASICALAAVAALALLASSALASPGQIDRSFGDNGIARPDLGPTFSSIRFNAIATLPDGAILATKSNPTYPAEPQIRRYQANGQLDPGTPPRPAADIEVTLADGDTLAATEQCCPRKLRLQRRNADGSVDQGFAEGGERTIAMPISPRKIVPLASGKILIGGIGVYSSSAKAPPINQVGVARLNADGSIDQSFHGDGIVWMRGAYDVVGADVGALAGRGDAVLVAVNATEGAVAFETTARGAADAETSLVALTDAGRLDGSFGDGGAVELSGSISAARVLVDGRILAAGARRGAKAGCCYAQSDFWLGRFTPSGAPDPTFGGGDGSATADLGGFDLAETALWEDGGSILLGGSTVAPTPICVQLFACEETPTLARFTADGGLDAAFGEGGELRLGSLAGRRSGSAAVGVLVLSARPGGGVLAAGSSGPTAFLAALGPSGALDPGFGDGGIVAEREPSPSAGGAGAMAVDGQGRILVAGHTNAGAAGYYPEGTLVRYRPDGRLDAGFGGGRGYVEVPIEGGDIAVDEGERAILLSEEGRGLTRVGADGTIDYSFGEGGIVFPAIALGLGRLGLGSIAALPGGGVLAAGSIVLDGGKIRIAVVRLHPNGSVDRSFGGEGIAIHGFGRGRPCAASKVLVQPDGHILLAGYVGRRGKQAEESRGFALMRLTADGSLDRGFGRNGRLPSGIGPRSEATDLALQDGRILAAGWLRRPGRLTTLLLRYRSNGRLDRGFARGGVARTAPVAAKASIWPWATSLVRTPRGIVVFRGTSTRPILAFRRNGRLERSYAAGADLAPRRITESWTSPGPLLASQAGAPILAWTAWEPAERGTLRQTIALRRLLAR